MVLILSCVLFLWACLGDSTSSVKSVHPVHQALGTVHTVDWGQFEFEPNRPLCRPLLCAASTGPTLSYAGSVSTLMARPDFLQYPANYRPILSTPLAQFSVTLHLYLVQPVSVSGTPYLVHRVSSTPCIWYTRIWYTLFLFLVHPVSDLVPHIILLNSIKGLDSK